MTRPPSINFDTTGTGGDGTYKINTVATDIAGIMEATPGAADAPVVFTDVTAVAEWSGLNESQRH